ncbi:hypothetical protein [uncultured Coprobacter sp.]|uniref:hypothetical protein n=1 Tax=uncultured Coprobacter sp. TaxID=1720550 RepID=UPI0026088503|nr:hypothetical protein [uncultured Coprobacter sp.]
MDSSNKIGFDIIGKVKRIKLYKSQVLLPVFEAIVNSIHSIQRLKKKNGIINVSFERDNSLGDLFEEGINLNPIKNFIIEDNGEGFNDINLTSFKNANSSLKLEIGGQGVGRFLWLKTFKNIHINSIYNDNETFYKREFDFKLIENGIDNFSETHINHQTQGKTTIKLEKLLEDYKDGMPRTIEDIGEKILSHILTYLMSEGCPIIKVMDVDNKKEIILNDLYKKEIEFFDSIDFEIKKYCFSIDLYKASKIAKTHELNYCADNRVVYKKPLSKEIPELNRIIKYNDKEFYLQAYLKGEYFNQIVDETRTTLLFPHINAEEEGDNLFSDIITEKDLNNLVFNKIAEGIDIYLKEIRDNKLERIKEFIYKKAPQYRLLFKYKKQRLEQLPILSEEKLELELFKIQHELEVDTKKEGRKIFKSIKTIKDYEEYQDRYNSYIEKVIDVGNTNLSKYIIHRKTIIDILSKNLKPDNIGKFALENTIHRLIFPLKATSDDLNYEDHNLWLIDERLSYHSYIASDKPFSKMDIIDSTSIDRPDIVAFNDFFDNRFALSESQNNPFPSVVIVEFKRPMRNEYSQDEKNPIEQVLSYIKEIRSDKKHLKNQRNFLNMQNVPFYCYIICDLTEKMREFVDNYDFNQTNDGLGYFGYHKNQKAYIEIISYDKLIQDAEKRNKILFDKLCLPTI